MNKVFSLITIWCAFTWVSCKSDYTSYVEQEVTKGITSDSLIFGMKMGQTRKDFFEVCWKMNKEQIISEGTGNKTARYVEPVSAVSDSTKRKDLLFYGIFDEKEVMRGMEMTYSYLSWAPWNKDRHAPALMEDLKTDIEQAYHGNPFIQVPIEVSDSTITTYIKIDGRRQIKIYPKNNKDVKVEIEDLHLIYPKFAKK